MPLHLPRQLAVAIAIASSHGVFVPSFYSPHDSPLFQFGGVTYLNCCLCFFCVLLLKSVDTELEEGGCTLAPEKVNRMGFGTVRAFLAIALLSANASC